MTIYFKSYVYRITHPITGKFYIGYRCGNKLPAKEDFGKIYKTSCKKLSSPFEEYDKIIIKEFDNRCDAYDFEQKLIFENKENPLIENKCCYYLKNRFIYHGPHSEETKRKISNSKKENITDETRSKLSNAAKNRKPISEETREKMRIAKLNRPRPIKDYKVVKEVKEVKETLPKVKRKRNRVGKPLSEETKRKISLAKSGKIMSQEHKNNISKAKLGKKRINVS